MDAPDCVWPLLRMALLNLRSQTLSRVFAIAFNDVLVVVSGSKSSCLPPYCCLPPPGGPAASRRGGGTSKGTCSALEGRSSSCEESDRCCERTRSDPASPRECRLFCSYRRSSLCR